MITLEYEQKRWINQPHATNVENVNPFNVIVFVGGIVMDPASDNWVRTIYLNDHRTESTGAKWKQEAKTTRDVDKKVEYRTYKKVAGRGEKEENSLQQQLLQPNIHQNSEDLLESLIMLKM